MTNACVEFGRLKGIQTLRMNQLYNKITERGLADLDIFVNNRYKHLQDKIVDMTYKEYRNTSSYNGFAGTSLARAKHNVTLGGMVSFLNHSTQKQNAF